VHGRGSNGGITPTAGHAGIVPDETVDDHRHRRGAKPGGKTSASSPRKDASSPRKDASSPRKDASLVDRVLGDFVLGEVLGRGGGGTVYRAEQRGLDRPAVVKVVHRALAARRGAAERFAREARLASRFDHPYAAHIYAFGVEHDGVMWIAMELVDGTPLDKLIRRSGPLALERFVPLFEQLCEVVQSAHDQGIVHRDIKPSNVMVLARAGRLMPKLLDFGLAKLMGAVADAEPATERDADVEARPGAAEASDDRGDSGPAGSAAERPLSINVWRSLTHQGQVLGSPTYMAPEQWADATNVGPMSDQYALALVAYEALAGARAFTGRTLHVLAERHRTAPLPALPGHLPGTLHAVLARACDKRPEYRFANLAELATAIRVATLGAIGAVDPSSATLPEDAAPYPGLAAYTAADHASFVGRERDLEALIERLDTQPIVTVVGPSGSGKTSFLAAGLAPSLAPGSHAELVRPGGDPPGVLTAILGRCDALPYRKLLAEASMSPAAIAAGLVELAEARDTRLVVIVDQAEELLTMCSDDALRIGFAEALVAASSSPRVRVVLALRDDFLCAIEQLPAWRGRLGRAVHVLGPPRRDDLERMITVPARRRGFTFDDAALPREIVEQVDGRAGALPLVAFTVAQLWEHRDRRHGRLTRAAYERMGGVIGALVQHADSVVDQMAMPDRRLARLMFRRLITSEGARVLISRAELEGSLGGQPAAAVIDRLLAARLIVSRDDDAGDRIEIIHETLATTWPRLAAWRREDADRARLQDQLSVAARHWNERGQAGDLLWRGDALSDLRRWHDSDDRSMTAVEQAFARASIAAAARARRTRIAIVSSGFAVLVAGILGLVSANRQIADQRAAAIDRVRTSFEERGRLAIADGDDARAMLYLAEASRLGARGPAFDLLASRAMASLDAGLEIIGHGGSGIVAMQSGAGGLFTVGWDLALARWDAGKETRVADGIYYATLLGDPVRTERSPSPAVPGEDKRSEGRTENDRQVLTLEQGQHLVIAVTARGDVVALDRGGAERWRAERVVVDPASRSGGIVGSAPARLVVAFGFAATLWDADTGRSRGELRHDKPVTAVALDAGGARAATGDLAGAIRIWDVAKREPIARCEPHAGTVRALRFAPDGRSLVSAGNDGEVRICDAATGAMLHRMIGHSHQVVALDITSDGNTIASGGRDGKPRIWDAQTGQLVRTLEGHRGGVIGAQVSPDDRQVLTFGLDGTARIWTRDGVALGSLQGHGGPIYAGGWDADGRHVITTSVDGAIRRWDPGRAIQTASRQAHRDAIADLAVSSDDRWVVTASADRRAMLWDRESLQPVAELLHGARVLSVELEPHGTSALTIDEGGLARLWRLPDAMLLATLGPGIAAATYTRDGQVVTAGDDAVRFWSSDGGELGSVAVGHATRRLVPDPSGRWLFAAGNTSSVVVIDIAARAPAARLQIDDQQVQSLATDGARVAVGDGAAIRLWRVGTWAALGTLIGHKSPVADVWFLSDGRLVSAAADATLVWGRDTRLSEKLGDTNRVLALATPPDGTVFATTAADGMIRIWDAATYRLLLQLPGHRLPAFALALTHDGTAVISGGNDGRLATWDLARHPHTPAELADLVRCRVPLRLEGDVALPRDLDFDDPKCRSLR
jgi:WD40 repeat protein/serine/threonine protein kinase